MRSIAAPIVDCAGVPIAALNIGTHASRWPIQKLTQEALPLLKQTATRIQRPAGAREPAKEALASTADYPSPQLSYVVDF